MTTSRFMTECQVLEFRDFLCRSLICDHPNIPRSNHDIPSSSHTPSICRKDCLSSSMDTENISTTTNAHNKIAFFSARCSLHSSERSTLQHNSPRRLQSLHLQRGTSSRYLTYID